MAVLNVKDVPEDLMVRLRARARGQNRSVRGEVLRLLGDALDREERDPRAVLATILDLRRSYRPATAGPTALDLLAEDRKR